jgi:3-oxoacyl-ACP reductase-like protein
MKNLRWVLPIIILFFVTLFFFLNSDGVQMGQAFEEMFRSRDATTKLTAIILSADLEDIQVQDVLSKLLPEAKGVERIAIMYSLYMHNGNLEHEFVDSIPVDEQGIKNLLSVESPLGSYFRAPFLRIIKTLGSIAMHDDVALDKLKRIYSYSDGWQGDSILEMILDAERRRGKDTDLFLKSLQ